MAIESDDPTEAPQSSLVLNPDQLQQYALLDPGLPALVLKLRNDELQRRFVYALLSLLSGLTAFLALIAGFVFLVLHGHPQAAAVLLTAGVVSLVGGFVRSRL